MKIRKDIGNYPVGSEIPLRKMLDCPTTERPASNVSPSPPPQRAKESELIQGIPAIPNAPLIWDYRSVLLPREADLSPFGADGWELVSVIPAPVDMACFYFKRRR